MRSAHIWSAVLGGCLASLGLLSGCDDLPKGPMSFDGIPGEFGLPTGLGVGEDCSSEACRPGLECVDDVCEPGMSLGRGDSCLIGPECESGLQCLPVGPCPQGGQGCPVCAPAGSGQLSDACQNDADCASGLRCGLNGFSAECVESGEGDLGAACLVQSDCFQGLFCVAGACALDDPRWQGVGCPPAPEGPTASLFQVPGASGTPGAADFFSLPFPTDIRLGSDGRPDLSGFPTPGPALVGQDVVAKYVAAVEANATGWSTNPAVVFRFTGPIDLDSFQDRVRFVDLSQDPAARLGLEYASGPRTNYVCDNWVSFSPRLGEPLAPNQTHALWISKGVTDEDGGQVEQSPQFAALLGASPPSDPALADAYAAYAPLRAYLDAAAIAPDTILVAAVFTTGDPRAPMRELAEAIADADAPTATDWVRCGSGAKSPCPQAEGGRACGSQAADFDEYQALVGLPIFQQGEAPYLTEGGAIASQVQRTEQVCLSLSIPKKAAPAAGWPLVIYGHGTGGSYRGGLRDEVAGELARSTPALAVLTIDQVQHGPRRGDSTEDPDNLFFNFLNPDAARGNPMQGAADQLSLLRFAQGLQLSSAESGGDAITIDPNSILLFGHSQGSTHGSLALPFSDFPGAVLSGNGGSLRHALLSKTNPVNIAGALPIILQDADSSGKLRMGDKHPVLALLQQHIDPADPLNYASALLDEPEPGQTIKHVFQTFGLDDTYSPPTTLAAFVYAAEGIALAPPPNGLNPTGDNELRLTPAAAPLSDNVTRGMTTVTGVTRQYPAGARDGHFVVFEDSAANDDALGFLRSLASGTSPAVPAQ